VVLTIRQDSVRETSYSLYFENQIQWTNTFRTILGMRGESYNFDVTSNIPQNSGNKTAGMGLPKLSLIYGPWNKSEFLVNAGESFHSNDARGVVATVDPKTLAPIGQATPLVRGKGAEAGVRTEIVPAIPPSLFGICILIRNSCTAESRTLDCEHLRPLLRTARPDRGR
jgi:TonB dependent receptor